MLRTLQENLQLKEKVNDLELKIKHLQQSESKQQEYGTERIRWQGKSTGRSRPLNDGERKFKNEDCNTDDSKASNDSKHRPIYMEQYPEGLRDSLEEKIKENDSLTRENAHLVSKLQDLERSISNLRCQDNAKRARGNYDAVGGTNQCTKLSECFEDLFKEEWKDAMRDIFKDKELAGIRFLSKILQECHIYCLKVAKDPLIKFVYLHQTKVEVNETEKILREEELQELLKIRKLVDQHPSVKLVVARSFWEKKYKEFQNVLGVNYKSSDRKKTLEDDNAQEGLDISIRNKSLSAYVHRCCNLCWQAAVMDPPVLLEFDVIGQKFDPISDRFLVYKPLETPGKNGLQDTVMEVVWPAVVSQNADDTLRRRLGNAKGFVVLYESSLADVDVSDAL